MHITAGRCGSSFDNEDVLLLVDCARWIMGTEGRELRSGIRPCSCSCRYARIWVGWSRNDERKDLGRQVMSVTESRFNRQRRIGGWSSFSVLFSYACDITADGARPSLWSFPSNESDICGTICYMEPAFPVPVPIGISQGRLRRPEFCYNIPQCVHFSLINKPGAACRHHTQAGPTISVHL